MALVVDVPRNTMLADLDETLRVLLNRELALARTREGVEATAEIAVPGAVLDLTVAPAKRAGKNGS